MTGDRNPSGDANSSRNREGITPAVFDRHAAHYRQAVDESIAFTGRDATFFAQRKVTFLRRLLLDQGRSLRQAKVLDVGCGTGIADRYLAGEVAELHGVDVSDEMIAEARRNVAQATFRLYDGHTLPYPSQMFDLVMAICVLHHVPEEHRSSFVQELNRVARRGGLIAIIEHNPANPLTRRAVNSCELDEGVALLRAKQVAQLLESAGAVTARANYLLFTPLSGNLGTTVDRLLRRLPLGGQHLVLAEASHT